MKFVDKVYDLYKDRLTGDEEDAYIIMQGIFEEFDRKDFVKIVQELPDPNIEEMVTYYMIELLRRKLGEEGVGHVTMNTDIEGNLLH
jgi:hypothetical protein